MADAGGLVNIKYSLIFNGVFEVQKSAKNAENFAEIRGWETWTLRIYHVCIKHDRGLRELYDPLRHG